MIICEGLLIEEDTERDRFPFNDLRPFQLEGIIEIAQNNSIFVIRGTGSGKTTIAKPCMGMALIKRVNKYISFANILYFNLEDLNTNMYTAQILISGSEFKNLYKKYFNLKYFTLL